MKPKASKAAVRAAKRLFSGPNRVTLEMGDTTISGADGRVDRIELKDGDAAEAGHNSRAGTTADGGYLRQIVERIERLEEDRAALGQDVREVYGEAKSAGFDPKILRKVVALRRRDLAERREEEALIEAYLAEVGEAA